MIIINNRQIYSDENKYIHRIDSETYFKRAMVLPKDTIDMYEEVDELPKYTEAEYKEKVRELIKERYTIEDEIALVNNKEDGKASHLKEYNEYLTYRNECKVRAKELLENGKEV